jgi:Amidase
MVSHRPDLSPHQQNIMEDQQNPVSQANYSQKILVLWKHQFKSIFQDVDIILTPTTPIVAPKFADSQDLQKATHGIMRNLVGLGYAGLPCLSVPVGFDSQGLPRPRRHLARDPEPALLPVSYHRVFISGATLSRTIEWLSRWLLRRVVTVIHAGYMGAPPGST